MPTLDQMNRVWASEFEYFGGQDPMTYKPPGYNPDKDFSGEVIGHIEIDSETREPRLVIHKDPKKEEEI